MLRMITLLFTLAAAPAIAQDNPAPQTAADHMVDSLKAEGNAMEACAGAIKADVKAGRVKLADGAEGRWDTGVTMWAEVRQLASEGKEKAAYDKMRELRHLFGDTLLTALDGKASKKTRDAFTAYWNIADTRIDHIVEYGKSHELSAEVKEHYTAGVGHWEKAKAAYGKKTYRVAFTEMLQGLDSLDHVMWTVHNAE